MKMKKWLALLLAALMLLSLVACGDEEETEPTETTEAIAATDPVESTETNVNLTVHENTFFTVGYDEAAGWSLAEDDIYTYDTGGYCYVRVLDEEGYDELVVWISATEEDVADFRELMHIYGIDQKAYAEGTLELIEVGGQPMFYADLENGSRYYAGRNEDAGVTYTIDASDWEDPRVAALVENIVCTASGTGNVDPLWPWEGEAFTCAPTNHTVDTYTLTSELIPMNEALITYDTFNHDVEILGDKVYLLSSYSLKEYTYDGTTLTFSKDISPDETYEVLERANDQLFLSSFMDPLLVHDGSSLLASYEGSDYFAPAPDGTWGISWFYAGEDCVKCSLSGDAMTTEPMPFNELSSVETIRIDDEYIYVTGYAAEDSSTKIFVYDHSGALQLQLTGDPEGFGLGSITFITKTEHGFLALDANLGEVDLWSADGTWLSRIDSVDIFGTYDTWLASGTVAEDGSILVVMNVDREDESAEEVVIFKLSGF